MKKYTSQDYTCERALYEINSSSIENCSFSIGESPIKETHDLTIDNCKFKGRYPIWYSKNISISSSSFIDDSRAGLWYVNNLSMKNCTLTSPKNLRKCNDVILENVNIENAMETLWNCDSVKMKNITIKGEYFAKGSSNLIIENLDLNGKYSFDTVSNVTIKDSKLITKDAFWNSENVIVENSYIFSEYIGWNSKNLTFKNCIIESLQGFCYIENLVIKNCDLSKTSLAFENSTVNIDTNIKIESIFNPISGKIKCPEIDDLTISTSCMSDGSLEIDCPKINKHSTEPTW